MTFLFIYAHMDDETMMSYGLMQKLIVDQHDVHLLTLCGNSRKDGSPTSSRKNAYKRNMAFLTSCHTCGYRDLTLTDHIVNNVVYKELSRVQPQHVITHSPADQHFEHRLISNSVLLQCRIKGQSSIKSLSYAVLPTINQAYYQYGNFHPNKFVDITHYIDSKIAAMRQYVDIGEIPQDNNDIRSLQSVLTQDRMWGFQIGVKYAEAYQQVFMKS